MTVSDEQLLFYDDLPAEQQEAVRAALGRDPALKEAFLHWQDVRSAIRAELGAAVPDRRMLVLLALESAGRGAALTGDDQAALDAARPGLEEALAGHPALQAVLRDVAEAATDFEAAWDHVVSGSEQPAPSRAASRPSVRPIRSVRPLRWAWRVAAVVALAAFVTMLMFVMQRDAGMRTETAARGETKVIDLKDGSSVRLLGGSSLTYSDAGGLLARRVRLTGRAFFEVTPGQQGFSVETPTAVATVLGTSFGVQSDGDSTEVVLASGRVSVASRAAQDRIVVLDPGQMTRVARDELPTTPTSVDIPEALAWTGLFLFRGTPLREAVARLEDHYGVEIAIPEGLAGEGVNGTFAPEESVEGVVRVLATALGATVEGDATTGLRMVGGR